MLTRWQHALLSTGVAAGVALGVVFAPTAVFVSCGVVILALLIARKPQWVIYAMALSAITTLPTFIPMSVNMGPVSARLYELLMFPAMIASLRYRPLTKLYALYASVICGLLVLWSLVGYFSGFSLDMVIHDVRQPLYMVGCMIIFGRIWGASVGYTLIRLLKPSLWISASVTVFGSAFGLAIAGRSEEAALSVMGASSEATRLLTPATYAAVAVLCGIVGLVLAHKIALRATWSYTVPALIIVLLSFSRNSLLALGVAILYGLLSSRDPGSIGRVLRLGASVAVLGSSLILFSPLMAGNGVGVWINNQVDGFTSRVLGGISRESLDNDPSAQYRVANENALILPELYDAPIAGHGFGKAYKLPAGPAGSWDREYAPWYAHNFYLWIWLKAGLVGLITFLGATLLPVLRTLRSSYPPATAVGAAGAALLAASFVAPMPIGSPTAAILGAIIGVCASSLPGKQLVEHAEGHGERPTSVQMRN